MKYAICLESADNAMYNNKKKRHPKNMTKIIDLMIPDLGYSEEITSS